MVKYMIQDIVPPGRKHTIHKGTSKDPVHKKSEPSTIRAEQQEVPNNDVHTPVKTTVSHALHHEQEPEGNEEVHEIHDDIIERPQAMIIENLYQSHEKEPIKTTETPAVNIDGGVYPYNKVSSEYRSPVAKPSWKFPETSNWSTKLGGWVPWVVIPLVLIVAGVFLMNHFAGATVLLIPKHDTLPIPTGENFSAAKNPTEGQLGFSVMKVTLDDSREVNATGTKTVTSKASGKIVIYNEQTVIQRLIKNTRFESAAGKIYRINDSINVPKATVKSGKTIPGTIEVTVYADEAGVEFNSPPSDFSVPGLKNTPQAKKVYGRSNGPITGGASGTVKSVSDQELKQAGEDLRISLETKLRTKARGDLAPAQIAYDQGIIVSLEEPKLSSQQASGGDKAIVTESGTLYMVVFDRAALTRSVAKALVPTYGGENIEMTNLESLSIGLPKLTGAALVDLDRLDFTLSGTPSLVWQVDEQKVKKELLGVQKTNFNLILSQYSNIERAKASIQPIWKSTFPTEEKAITVKLVDEIPN
jgi:hypothetical protein